MVDEACVVSIPGVPVGRLREEPWLCVTELVTDIVVTGWLLTVEIVDWAAVPDPSVAEFIADEV
jgi:hypothetical protein